MAPVWSADSAIGTLVEGFVMKSPEPAAGSEVHTLRISGELGSLATPDGWTIELFSERPDYLPGGALARHAIRVPEADTLTPCARSSA